MSSYSLLQMTLNTKEGQTEICDEAMLKRDLGLMMKSNPKDDSGKNGYA